MIDLVNIYKNAPGKDSEEYILEDINLSFPETGLVLITGASGSGKSTLLNLLAGLDKPSKGEFLFYGKSTQKYSDREFSYLRCASVGYAHGEGKLMSHLTVVSNVEFALAISGVERDERRKRALAALEDAGIEKTAYLLPDKISAAERELAAIAAALVNEPGLMLIDNPLASLDDLAAEKVLERLSDMSSKRLVVMTANLSKLTKKYADRIISMEDGKVSFDSKPEKPGSWPEEALHSAPPRAEMPLGAAFAFAFRSLFGSLKGVIPRIAVLAGGVLCFALMLSLRNGITDFTGRVQEYSISRYPIRVGADEPDTTSLVDSIEAVKKTKKTESVHGRDAVYSHFMLGDLMKNLANVTPKGGDISEFISFYDSSDCKIRDYESASFKMYNPSFALYSKTKDGQVVKIEITSMLQSLMTRLYGNSYSRFFSSKEHKFSNFDLGTGLMPGKNQLVSDTIKNQYDLLYGSWPTKHDEVVLFVDKDNEISNIALYGLGLVSEAELMSNLKNAIENKNAIPTAKNWSYKEICDCSLKLILTSENYTYEAGTGIYKDMSDTKAGREFIYNSDKLGVTIKISGIARAKQDAIVNPVNGSFGYTVALMDHLTNRSTETEAIKAQLADSKKDVLSNLPFQVGEAQEEDEAAALERVNKYLAALPATEKAAIYTALMSEMPEGQAKLLAKKTVDGFTRDQIEEALLPNYSKEMDIEPKLAKLYLDTLDKDVLYEYALYTLEQHEIQKFSDTVRAELASLSVEELAGKLDKLELSEFQLRIIREKFLPPTSSKTTYEERLASLGYIDKEKPKGLTIYAATFPDKMEITKIIDRYNENRGTAPEVFYNDITKPITPAASSIISALRILSTVFTVLTILLLLLIISRTVPIYQQEVAIMRLRGASKTDVKSITGAESVIVGIIGGLIGVGLAYVVTLPLNKLFVSLTSSSVLRAHLPYYFWLAVALGTVAMTFVAGLMGTKSALRVSPTTAMK
ncbi:MAG: ATP-binding cassette domain-containing protein [Ruminococcaceae bacterium]|nr:ATP-binding cassette domain-containing protein [Oscillospiraceae bacterium]